MNRIIFLLMLIHTASGYFWFWLEPQPTSQVQSQFQKYPEFPSPKSCPENFFALNERFCYFFSNDEKNFHKAIHSCNVLKSSMIYLYETAEGELNLNSLLMFGGYESENYWVGGNYLKTDETWCDYQANQVGCLTLSIKNGFKACINRENCTKEYKYICEYALYE